MVDDYNEGVLGGEIQPQIRPRDQAGKFIREGAAPEPMFGLRPIEGDPLTGDTRDGGDDARLRALERDVADGYEQGREPAQDRQNLRRAAVDAEDDDGATVRQPERVGPDDAEDAADLEGADEGAELEAADAEGDNEQDAAAKYEVIVDGETKQVSLKEALNGYVRQATFHKRMGDLNGIQANLEADAANQQKGWQLWHKARQDYEEDLAGLIPQEPNWDQEFARDPAAAHANQKIYQTIYAKLNASRQARAEREAADAQEADRRLQKYAVDGFTKFVAMHPKVFPDEPTLKKNIQSMRRTAMAAGFSELEVATVYDPRMLTILLKASKYDRITANKPKVVDPGKGRTLQPGAATPIGNAPRKGLDEAQRRLASSGRLDDAADVFRRLL